MLVHPAKGQSDYFVWYFFLQLGGNGQSEVLVNKNEALLKSLSPFLKSDKIPLFLYSNDCIRLLNVG